MTLTDQTNTLQKIEASFNRYRSFKDGWADGGGEGTSPELIDCLIELCQKFYPANLPSPLISPMVDGGFSFEWSLNAVDISLDIDDDPCLADLSIFDTAKAGLLQKQIADKVPNRLDPDSMHTHIDVDITTPEGWETVNKTVSKFLKVEQLTS